MNASRPHMPSDLTSTYVDSEDRFVVALVVSYSAELLAEDHPDLAPEVAAARAALDLTRDLGSADTQWQVFDRELGTVHHLEQSEFAPAEHDSTSFSA